MVNKNNKIVNIKVHSSYFDNIFEPERKKLATRLGLNDLSQTKFTEFLAKSNAQIKYKPVRTPRFNNKFSPKRIRGSYFI
jgi:hypothetical protein